MANRLRPGQFTLGSLFIATAIVALACVAARYVVTPNVEPESRWLAWLTLPVLLAGAVGVLRRRLGSWLGYGVAIAIAVNALALLAELFGLYHGPLFVAAPVLTAAR